MTQDKVHIRETFGTVAIFTSRLEILNVTFVASFRWKIHSWAVEFKWSAKLGRPRTTLLTTMFLVTYKSMGSIGTQEDSKSACLIYLFIYLFFLLFCNKTTHSIIQSEQILHKRQHLQISTSNRHKLKEKKKDVPRVMCQTISWTESSYFLDSLHCPFQSLLARARNCYTQALNWCPSSS